MNIAISGATGFIGGRLTKYLTERGYRVYPLTRELFEEEDIRSLMNIIEGVDVVVNLAGAPINKRWTAEYKDSIIESRVVTTRKIVQAINRSKGSVTLISASAVGYYPSVGCYDEMSRVENYSFLSYVCRLWEREAHRLKGNSRLVVTRFGVVFSHGAGALQEMLATRTFGFLPRIGALDKPISWVDREDLIRAIEFIIEDEGIEGVVNIVSPRLTMQRDLLTAANKRYNTHLTLPIPAILLRLLCGQASEVITKSPCVSSRKLTDAGFKFRSASIYDFFERQGL